ncbi:short chain dehydrogenase [Ruegeria denitrificans]|uniref:Short chain dehydrogenase n=1 Tax=Ruegeria denitrificans TaxID=1715692 RepID=A0A0P1IGR7_9RHOB|nr:SDR family oxidoreductase [Ruegeria denitrificans]CUK12395.1 short chain dehydrogenase [Ruegeria denitrificans]
MRLSNKNVLVLGAYGFIGAAVTRSLQAEGAHVAAFVRNLKTGAKVLPDVTQVQGDLRTCLRPEDWAAHLERVDCVVNCAGALQDGPADDLETVHHNAIAALGQACAQRSIAVVQISAIGADTDAETDFMRTKATGDAALRACDVPLWIFKPGLVIGQSDYGGTALLRMLAAVPFVQPIAYPQAPVQCVGMPDLCHAVTGALVDEIPQGTYDLVEDMPAVLSDVLAATRSWLGFPEAQFSIIVPPVITRLVARGADALGHLGWRSPLRSNAMTVMGDGVVGDPEPYRAATGQKLAPLPQIYAGLICSREHRLAARMSLLMPLVVAVLSLFWLLSGLFGLVGLPKATSVLTGVGWSTGMAVASVLFWSFVDIALGLAILWRPWAARACLAQVAVAIFYLPAASFTVSGLWLDPLGPLIKTLPAMTLSLVAWPLLQSR